MNEQRSHRARVGGWCRWTLVPALLAAAAPAVAPASPGGSARSAAAASGARSNTTQAGESRGVLLVTIDTLRRDALGAYGGPATTPNLDSLAASGARFSQAVAHAVLTLPSHTSIMTGLDPSRHGVHDNVGFRASETLYTWAERLQEAGFATGAFVGAFPLDSQFGLSQGFEVYDDYYGSVASSPFRMIERPGDEVVAAARRWIRRQRGDWFAWVHVYDPHAPYTPPAPYDERHPDAPYVGEIEFVDASLAPLLGDASRRGAMVIVTADHGESLGEHGEETHGVFAYEATLAVPLIVAGLPGIRPGSVISERVAHEDLLPTVLDALGLPADGTEGRSLLPLLRGQEFAADRYVYFESLSPNLARNWAPLRGVYDGPWKFIDLPLPELYRVAEDPGETRNLADGEAVTLARLKRLLDDHLAGAGGPETRVTEDPATLRRLRALGYVGSGGGPRADGAREYGPDDDPKNLMVLDHAVQEAVVAAERGDLDAALAQLEEVLRQRPDFVDALSVWATIENGRGHTEQVIERLSAAVEQPWATPKLRSKLGLYLMEAGRYDEAASVLEGALARQPDNLEVLTLLATVHARAGRDGEAERLLEHALAVDPTYVPLYVNRGTLRLERGRFEQAAADFREAIRYDPRSSEAHNGLGVAYWQSGRQEQAIEEWRTAISLNDNNLDALRNLGINLVRLNRFAEGVEVLDKLIAATPEPLWERYQIPQIRTMVARIKRDQGIR